MEYNKAEELYKDRYENSVLVYYTRFNGTQTEIPVNYKLPVTLGDKVKLW